MFSSRYLEGGYDYCYHFQGLIGPNPTLQQTKFQFVCYSHKETKFRVLCVSMNFSNPPKLCTKNALEKSTNIFCIENHKFTQKASLHTKTQSKIAPKVYFAPYNYNYQEETEWISWMGLLKRPARGPIRQTSFIH